MPLTANGLAPAILDNIKDLNGAATPHHKLDLNGFVGFLYGTKAINPIVIIDSEGHKKTKAVRYRQRPTYQMTDTAASCTDVNIPARLETTVSTSNVRQIAYMLTDQLVASYANEASKAQGMPGSRPLTGASAEMMDIIMSAANALMTGVNRDLSGLVTWGKNVPANSTAIQTLDLKQNSPTTMLLTNGETKLLTDYVLSGLTRRPAVVGEGRFLSYMFQQFAKSANSAGLNTAMMASQWDFFPDVTFPTVALSNANGIGVFEPGSIHIVESLEYQGFAGGVFPGDSIYGVLPLPYTDYMGNSSFVEFDFQLRYITCPTTFVDAYAGGNTASQTKGWQLILKKDFGLFQTPADAYRHEDRNRSVNGALRFAVDNT